MMNRIALVLATTLAVACSKPDSTADSTKVAQAGAADAPRVVKVMAHDFSFMGAPDSIPAGVTTFELQNNGTTFHHLIIVRLDSGKTVADLDAAMKKHGPPPAWMVMVGGPNAPSPNATSNATVDLTAGNYAMLCVVDVPGGVPHFAKGMIKGLTVTASAGSSSFPAATDTVTLNDYSFKLSRPLTAGSHTFRVVSEANQPHELELIKLAPGKKASDVLAWIQNPKGPPPGEGIGGTAPAVKGVPVYFKADLSAGDYVLVCFVPGPDGKPHFAHGMQLTQTVQ
jgi:hypothetical protein